MDLTPDRFDGLLAWLDPDRERAGVRYEEIRAELIRRFRQKGCRDPESLADDTVNRVAAKLPGIIDSYTGDPANYFYAVARYISMESLRRPKAGPPS